MDPRVAKFIAAHHRSDRDAALDDVAPWIGKTPEETWADVVSVCRATARQLRWLPDRDAVVAHVDPPHPSYAAIIARLRARAPR